MAEGEAELGKAALRHPGMVGPLWLATCSLSNIYERAPNSDKL